MPFAISGIRSWLRGARMAAEIQPGYLVPVSAFSASSPVWIASERFSEGVRWSEFQGNEADLFERDLPRNVQGEGPEQTVVLVVTPAQFVTLARSFAGDFVGDVASWPKGIQNRLSVAFRDMRATEPGQAWRIEDAWIPSITLLSPGNDQGELVAIAQFVGENVTVESTPGASFSIPDSPTAAEMAQTFRHRAARYFRDPTGSGEEFLPNRIEVSVLHRFDTFRNGQRISSTGRSLPVIIKGARTRVRVRLAATYSDQYRTLREDARTGTVKNGRIRWTDGPRSITLDLRGVRWLNPDRAAANRQIEEMELEGFASSSADGATPALTITKSGF